MSLRAIDDAAWQEFVASRAEATIFHHPAWARVLTECYGYRAQAVAREEHGAIASGVPAHVVDLPFAPRRWVSLPFTDHCPPLGDADAAVWTALDDEARASRCELFEVRARRPEATDDGAFVRHTIALGADTRALWKRLRRNHRRSVDDAVESGVRVVRGADAADVATFYRIHLQTRRRLGVPVQPRRFFSLLHERIVRPGLGFVLSAYLGDTAVASALFCAWNGTLICKYSGRADGFERSDAIHLLFWTGIRWAVENGYHTFDLGRTDVGQTQLRSFKVGWGTFEEPLPYSYLGRAPRASTHRVERAMGGVIRRSSPWVCRAIGEVLYRYAA